jgi:hypothetical protein
MSRAPLLMPVLAIAAAATALGGAASPALAKSSCAAKKSKTILQTSLVRVYMKRGGAGVQYLCFKRNGRSKRIGTADCVESSAAHFKTAGKLLAYVETECGAETQDDFVHVYDLKAGRQVADLADTDSGGNVVPPNTGDVNTGVASTLALDAAGNVAWIGNVTWYLSNVGADTGAVNQVRLHRAKSKSSAVVTLDQGAQIPTAPITLGGGNVSWVNAGMPKSAPIAS